MKKYLHLFTFLIFAFFIDGAINLSQSVQGISSSGTSVYYDDEEYIEYTISITNSSTDSAVTISSIDMDMGANNFDFDSAQLSHDKNLWSKEGSYKVDPITGVFSATDVTLSKGGYIDYHIIIKTSVNADDNIIVTSSYTQEGTTSFADNTTVVQRVPYEISIIKSQNSGEYKLGENHTYTVKISNNGQSRVKNLSFNDNTLDAQTEDTSGTLVNAFVSASNSGTSLNSLDSIGTFNEVGELNVSGIEIEPGSYVEYQIVAKTANNIVGQIKNWGNLNYRDVSVDTNEIITKGPEANIIINKEIINTGSYKVEDEIRYKVTVTNTGEGIGNNINVVDEILNISANLANPFDTSHSSLNTLGNPLVENVTTITDIGNNSTSNLGPLGATATGNLNDSIIIYPNEKIEYELVGKTSPVSIGTINNKAKVVNTSSGSLLVESNQVSINHIGTIDESSAKINITKNSSVNEYMPGDTVVYTVIARNTDSEKFADNVHIIDDLSTITAKQLDGSIGPAFSSWNITLVEEGSGNTGRERGTRGGLLGTATDVPLDVLADIAPNDYVKYEIVVTISETTVGNIVDNSASDNVNEDNSGITMKKPQLEVVKLANQVVYSPGGTVTYTVIVRNVGEGYAVGVPILDDLSGITTVLADGTNGKAFTEWTITGESQDLLGGTGNSHTDHGLVPNPTSNPEVLDVEATIYPQNQVVYTIVATINPLAVGEIINRVTVNGELNADKGIVTDVFEVDGSKSVDKGTYALDIKNNIETLTYKIRIENHIGNGFATDVPVKDDISSIEASLLHPEGAKKKVFKSWTIEAEAVGIGSDAGAYADNTNLDTIVNVAPGGYVEYTIVGVIDEDVESEIIYGNISNRGIIDGKNYDVTTSKKVPKIEISKWANDANFEPGKETSFTVEVRNVGDGYGNEVRVTDSISSMNAFESWTIVAETDNIGGSRPGDYSDNKDIDTTIDIAPGGYVRYVIKGKVYDTYNKDLIVNTAKGKDPISGNEYITSGDVGLVVGDISLGVSKTANVFQYTPGDKIEYTIKITNHSNEIMNDVDVYDLLNESNDYTLANNKDGTITDVQYQGAFEQFSLDNVTYYDISTAPHGIDQKIDVINPGETIELKLWVIVKDNVFGKILNDVYLSNNGDYAGHAQTETNKNPNGGGLSRVVNINEYMPGDTLTYTVKANSVKGYLNNYTINEAINSIEVELLDGTKGNPYYNKNTGKNEFTVTVSQSGTADANGGGTVWNTGTVLNNEDINDVIDVGPGDTVTYVISGNIRGDAVGEIVYKSLVTAPYKANLTIRKESKSANYIPGSSVKYLLTIYNRGQGSEGAVSFKDELSKIMVETVDGTMEPAFTSWTIIGAASNSDYYYLGNFEDNKDIDTIVGITGTNSTPETLTYTIDAVVNERAVGAILNTAYLGLDSSSNAVTSSGYALNAEKKVINYYDKDGSLLSDNKYVPGGYIEYELKIKNTGSGIANDIKLEDNLLNIQTDYFDGTRGKAFDSWEISLLSKDTSGLSNEGNIPSGITSTPLDTLVDIGPVTGEIVYKIKAKVDERAVGEIRNSATLKNINVNSEISTMATNKVLVTKEAFEDDTFTSIKSDYIPGESLVYKIRIENTGKGTLYNYQIKDEISKMRAHVVENGSNGDTPSEQPFANETWQIWSKDSNEITTVSGKFEDGSILTDADINETVSISGNGYIEYYIKASIKDTVLGDIHNTIHYGSTSKKNTVKVRSTSHEITKEILSIDRVTYTTGLKYKPGDLVIYKLTFENKSDNYLDNYIIKDVMSSVMVEVAGGNRVSAFESFKISDNRDRLNKRTYLPIYDVRNDLEVEIDLAPRDKVEFLIVGKIRDDALGIIDGNTIDLVGKESITTDTISPVEGILSGDKVIITRDGEVKESIYTPSGVLRYKIAVENTGDGFVNDVNITDNIGNITTTTQSGSGKAFTNWSIETMLYPNDSSTIITGDYSNNKNLDVNIDLAPHTKLEFIISAVVNEDVIGDIINTVDANGTIINDNIAKLKPSNIYGIKYTDTPYYVPGGTVNFYLKIYNIGNSTAANVSITDDLSTVLVETAGENRTLKKAFKSFTPSIVYGGGSINTSGDIITWTGNINAQEDVVIKVEGTVIDNAVGLITNIASASYDTGSELIELDMPLREGYIRPKSGQVEISQNTGEYYIPNTNHDFIITLTNTGEGYATDVLLYNDIEEIISEIASFDNIEDKVINSWDNVSTQVSTSNSAVYALVNTSNEYSLKADIHPGDSIDINLNGLISSEALGVINNRVTSTYGKDIKESIGTTTSTTSALSIVKESDNLDYQPGQEVTYRIKVTNSGNGWSNNSWIYDSITGINTEISGGGSGIAFEPSSIVISDNVEDKYLIYHSTTNLDANVDIKPNTTAEFVVKGRVKENALGEIKNIGILDETSSSENILSQRPAGGTFEKRVVGENVYHNNQKLIYELEVKNTTDSFANDVNITDDLLTLEALLGDGTNGNPFSSWTISHTSSDSRTVVGTYDKTGSNLNVNIDLAPNSNVIFRIEALVKSSVVGNIKNSALATYGLSSIKSETDTPPGNISFEGSKKSYKTHYIPGTNVVYQIEILNTSENFINDARVVDNLDNVLGLHSDGTTSPAFVTGTGKAKVIYMSAGVESTYTLNTYKTGNLVDTIDMPIGGKIIYEVEAQVHSDLVGEIVNIASVDGINIESNSLIGAPPVISAELYTPFTSYIPGSDFEYRLRVKNDGFGMADNIEVTNIIRDILIRHLGTINTSQAFDNWEVSMVSVGDNTTSMSGVYVDQDIDKLIVDISPNGKVEYLIRGKLNEEGVDPILVEAQVIKKGYTEDTSITVNNLSIKSEPAIIELEKISDKSTYDDKDTEVIYTLTAKNTGFGHGEKVLLEDKIDELIGVNGNNVFTGWVIEVEESGQKINTPLTVDSNTNINQEVNLKHQEENIITYKITGTINKGIDDDITNRFSAYDKDGNLLDEASVTNHIKKIPDNTGNLKIYKKAFKKEANVGDLVEYEILLDNINESYFKEVEIVDIKPGPFTYLNQSAVAIYSGIDGIFGTEDDYSSNIDPEIKGNNMYFAIDTLNPYEKVKIRYIMKVSVGALLETYTNRTYASVKGKVISNEDQAKVTIIPDPLFDTSTIIGKVFEDINGDGYQNVNFATGIKLSGGLNNNYTNLVMTFDNGEVIKLEEGLREIYIGKLFAKSKLKSKIGRNKVIIRYDTDNLDWERLAVESNEGTRIILDPLGEVYSEPSGRVKNGENTQKIKVTRRAYKKKGVANRYVQEIIIENGAYVEEGIPGVRLFTVDGYLIETDQYGRYHVPDQWVEKRNGENFILKLDKDTLPTSMDVNGPNPKVTRITGNSLTKINWPIITEEEE